MDVSRSNMHVFRNVLQNNVDCGNKATNYNRGYSWMIVQREGITFVND